MGTNEIPSDGSASNQIFLRCLVLQEGREVEPVSGCFSARSPPGGGVSTEHLLCVSTESLLGCTRSTYNVITKAICFFLFNFFMEEHGVGLV